MDSASIKFLSYRICLGEDLHTVNTINAPVLFVHFYCAYVMFTDRLLKKFRITYERSSMSLLLVGNSSSPVRESVLNPHACFVDDSS